MKGAIISGHDKKLICNSTAEFLIFTGQAGEQRVEARNEDETASLTQKLMPELFAMDVRTVSEHPKNVYESGKLSREAILQKFRTVQIEGSRQVVPGRRFLQPRCNHFEGLSVNSGL